MTTDTAPEREELPTHVADPTTPSTEPQPLDPHPLKSDPFTTP